MTLKLHNTLTRRVEPFTPLQPPRVTLYTCGPTVWNYAHIGNFRTFVFEDLLRRYLEYCGFSVFHIMNLTDVDDRTIQAATKAGVPLTQHTEPFTQAFFGDRDYMRILPAHVYPRATQYIAPMVDLISGLLKKGLAYQGTDGVYFAIDKFSGYGALSGVQQRELKAGARVASDEYDKENAQDFALWKAADEADEKVGAAWDAPFGRGRPGWHLECSAMALKEIAQFGVETLDLHCGAVDLIFPHHENEIAQSEGVTGKPFVRHWLHGEFLTVGGTKMSKRFGNFLTARDLSEQQVDAGAIRYLFFQTHYRQQLNFTDEALQAARVGTERLAEFRGRLARLAGDAAAGTAPGAVGELVSGFRSALDDDLNGPQALAAVATFVRTANRELDGDAWTPSGAQAALSALDKILGVLQVLPAKAQVSDDLARTVEAKIAERTSLRKKRDFAGADRVRKELMDMGIELEDTPKGTLWKRRP